MTFQPGQSGNPAGRPPGIKNRSTRFVETILEGDSEDIIRAAIAKAKEGDVPAIRVCLDRLSPRLRERDHPIAFELPRISSVTDALPAMSAITAAVAAGELSASEAGELSQLVNRWIELLQTIDFEARLKRVEERIKEGKTALDP